MSRFKDKAVLITGGGSGIGRATAIAFARENAKVMVADIVEADGRQTVDLIQKQGGIAEFTSVDVSSSDSVSSMVEQTIRSFHQLDVYFSNAGIMDNFGPCEQMTDAMWTRVLGVNLSGCFFGARAAVPHLAKTKGNIVVTASVASLGAMAGGAAYTASKYGVVGLVNQLACEMAAQGVRVNGIAPGPIRTNIGRDMPKKDGIESWVKATTPLGRYGEPEEIAEPVLFLASSAASYITGTLLRVDGGWRSK